MADTILEQTTQPVEPTPNVVVPEVEVATTPTEPSKWYADEFEAVIAAKGFKDPNDVLKSLTNLEKLVGNSVRVPPADASPEAKQDFYDKIKDVDGVLIKTDEKLLNKLGKPETAEAYKLEQLISEDLRKSSPEVLNEIEGFKKLAFEAGLTEQQAEKIVSMRLQTVQQESDAFLASKTKAEQELRTLWGTDFDNRLNAVKQVSNIYSEKFGDEMLALINSPAGNNPALINMMNELAEVYKEKGHAGLSTTQFGITPEQAVSKIKEKRADRGFMEAYQDDRHPGHNKAVQELQHLYKLSNGE